jgi:hypothetical protein
MKCAYCNDDIGSEQYYEIMPLVGCYLHIDCIGEKDFIGTRPDELFIKLRIYLRNPTRTK